MSYLNDRQIRELCMVPTHGRKNSRNLEFAKFNDKFYTMSGHEVLPKNVDLSTIVELPNEVQAAPPPRMIVPFIPGQVRQDNNGGKIISYGTSSMGYDVRLGRKFKIFTNAFNALIDPLDMPISSYVDHEGDYVIIPPNSYVLGHTIEYFNLPRDVGAICVGKSTYARVGCIVNVTPIEPGFCGEVVIELSNATPLPMKVYAGQGIAQFIFFRGEPCEVSYADRDGKYQGQTGIQTALV